MNCHHVGVFKCNYIKETRDANEDEEYRVVDEEKAPASGFPAKGSAI